MERSIRVYTQGWHYLLEGIIISYIVLFWERFSMYHDLSFWSFYLVLIPSVIVFALITYYNIHWVAYFFVLAALIGVLYMLTFPISVAVVFSLLLVYRYYRISRAEYFYKETTLLGVSTAIALFTYFWSRNPEVFLILLLQYGILLVGYYLKNVFIFSESRVRKQYIQPLARIFLTITGVGVVTTFFYSGILSRVLGWMYQSFAFLTVRTSSSVATFIDDSFEIYELDPYPLQGEEDDGIWSSYMAPSLTKAVEDYVVIYIIIVLLVIALCVFMIFRLVQRKSGKKHIAKERDVLIRTEEEIDRQYGSFDGGYSKQIFSRKPKNEVRKLVYQFEKRLAKTNHRRKPFETIENWLNRIGAGSELVVYQKVRYGNKEVENAEISHLKEELKTLENHLKKS